MTKKEKIEIGKKMKKDETRMKKATLAHGGSAPTC